MTRTLLIDADILAYQASSACQREYDFGDGPTCAADMTEATAFVDETVAQYAKELKADAVILCLSDDFRSFRKERVDPTYKAVRSNTERPVLLYDVKDWMVETYETDRRPTLEADDVMGILSTDPARSDERIIVSADKDMMTVPGLLVRPHHGFNVLEIDEEEADYNHLYQTVVGDATDGYPGCPGSGPKAARVLLTCLGWEQYTHTFLRGPRKGEEEARWRQQEMPSAWAAIVSAYAKAGLTEEDAIKQARLARILRYAEWDGKAPRLWSPVN